MASSCGKWRGVTSRRSERPIVFIARATAPIYERLRGVVPEIEWPVHAPFVAAINALKKERNAVILAHNYQLPEVQDLADFTGDSLGLSLQAQEADEDLIVFCGVHFMAETAKILNPERIVVVPDMEAGCSLAESCPADQLAAWKAEHPGAVVVSYVNTTAEVKAETDICCTSSNAVEVVESIPRDQEILFCPDQFLGAHVQRMTGRDNMHIWLGECHVHAGINGADLREREGKYPVPPGAPDIMGLDELSEEDKATVARARKVARFLSQPFFVAEQFTGKPGRYVKLEDTIRSFTGLVNGEYDHIPEQAFFYVGPIEEAVEKAYREGDEDLRRSLLEAAKERGGESPLDLLRRLLAGRPHERLFQVLRVGRADGTACRRCQRDSISSRVIPLICMDMSRKNTMRWSSAYMVASAIT